MSEVFANRFELLDQISAGGMGDVWTARDLTNGSVVALKLMRPGTQTSLLRFMREQSLRIHHPHVVTPLAWAGEDARVGFSMPLVCGGSVATLLGDYGPLPPRYAAELMRQLVKAVRAVHEAGIVHRDIKPANLLLDPTGFRRPRLRLTDFGVAQPLDEPRLTMVTAAVGTPGYLSPEQQDGEAATPAQDLYAIGRVGLAVLTGLEPDEALHQPPPEVDAAFWGTMVALTSDRAETRPSLDEVERMLAAPQLAWMEQREIEVFELVSPQGVLDQAMTQRRIPHHLPTPTRHEDAAETVLLPARTPAPAPASPALSVGSAMSAPTPRTVVAPHQEDVTTRRSARQTEPVVAASAPGRPVLPLLLIAAGLVVLVVCGLMLLLG